MTFRLPDALQTSDDSPALVLLRRYYGQAFGSPRSYRGAAFDDWDSSGTREVDANVFTADDLVAVSLSVRRSRFPGGARPVVDTSR